MDRAFYVPHPTIGARVSVDQAIRMSPVYATRAREIANELRAQGVIGGNYGCNFASMLVVGRLVDEANGRAPTTPAMRAMLANRDTRPAVPLLAIGSLEWAEAGAGLSFLAMLGVLGYIAWANRQPEYTPNGRRRKLKKWQRRHWKRRMRQLGLRGRKRGRRRALPRLHFGKMVSKKGRKRFTKHWRKAARKLGYW